MGLVFRKKTDEQDSHQKDAFDRLMERIEEFQKRKHQHLCASCGKTWNCGDNPKTCDRVCVWCGGPAAGSVIDKMGGD